jgi:hypothetical protein
MSARPEPSTVLHRRPPPPVQAHTLVRSDVEALTDEGGAE